MGERRQLVRQANENSAESLDGTMFVLPADDPGLGASWRHTAFIDIPFLCREPMTLADLTQIEGVEL